MTSAIQVSNMEKKVFPFVVSNYYIAFALLRNNESPSLYN